MGLLWGYNELIIYGKHLEGYHWHMPKYNLFASIAIIIMMVTIVVVLNKYTILKNVKLFSSHIHLKKVSETMPH